MFEKKYSLAVAKAILRVAAPHFAEYLHEKPEGLFVQEAIQTNEPEFSWTYSCDLPYPFVEPLLAPALPAPFTARELAAFMLSGVGALITSHFGLVDKGPDPDLLAKFGPQERSAKEAIQAAYEVLRAAEEVAGHYPPSLASNLTLTERHTTEKGMLAMKEDSYQQAAWRKAMVKRIFSSTDAENAAMTIGFKSVTQVTSLGVNVGFDIQMWAGLGEVHPLQAARLLTGKNPVCDSTDESGAKTLMHVFESEAKSNPQGRTMLDWLEVARNRKAPYSPEIAQCIEYLAAKNSEDELADTLLENDEQKAETGPQPILTPSIAYAFAGLHDWGEGEWKRNLGKQPKWLKGCVAIAGQKGVRATAWNPVSIGAALVEKGATAKSVRSRFQTKHALKPWLDGWKTYEADYLSTEP